ncbi:MAG: M14 family zinc carboxypeptidase [Flavobacteriales bacterium]
MSIRTTFPVVVLSLLLAVQASAQEPMRYHRVKIHTSGIMGGLRSVAALGIAVDHGQVKEGEWMTTDLSDAEIAQLASHGYRYDVLIEDVSAYYASHSAMPAEGGQRADASCNTPTAHAQPTHFELGSMAGYYTWQEMLDILDEMAALYPDLISVKQPIGQSIEGRPLHFVRISNAPNIDQDKPEVFYNALIHAREPAALSQVIYFMWYLLENYNSDAYVQYLLDNTELYIVPCINPDGYVYNEAIEPAGGGMWRKNRRDNGDGTFGVDLNRNYGWQWGYDDLGSSGNPGSEVYRGETPFSEPENQALRDFCDAHDFRLALNHHTYGNLLVYPWGYQASFFTPDSAVFATYGQILTKENGFLAGTDDQTVGYVTNGTIDDWQYGDVSERAEILGMTPESGGDNDGFWPPVERITPLSAANLDMNLNEALLAGRYAKAADRSPSILADASGYIVFDLRRLGLEPATFTVGLEPLEHVASTGTPTMIAGMSLLETHRDSVAYTLDPGLVGGDAIRFVLTVNNGLFTFRDTLNKVYGQPTIAFAEDDNSLSDWVAGSWGTTTGSWFTPPSSVTDSPFGNYEDNDVNTMAVVQWIDLTNAAAARLEFMAHWDIEPGYDFVQVFASSDGNNWTPLCGRYTHPGSTFQAPDEPLYDGLQTEWVAESMDLGAYVGGDMRIRFRLVSDQGSTRDGFYFDDLSVVTAAAGPVGVNESITTIDVLASSPNPADAHTMITFTSMDPGAYLAVYNSQGALVRSIPVNGAPGRISVNTSDLASGVYQYGLVSGTTVSPLKRLVVIHP